MRIDSNTTIKLGDRNIVKIKRGDVVIWEKETVDYFYVENTYSGGNTISIKQTITGEPDSSLYAKTLQYSKDKTNWSTITLSSTTYDINLNQGERVYFRGNEGVLNYYSNDATIQAITNILGTQSHVVCGNINTLVNYITPNELTLTQGVFALLFQNNTTITSAENLTLPATQIAEGCYRGLFYGCTSLTSIPELPATELAPNCYRAMLANCTSLTTSTKLPATKLSTDCYRELFFKCTSLVNPPELPAEILAEGCYRALFFKCTSLNNITVYANDISTTDCTTNWLSGVASSGTFNNYGDATYTINSVSGIPTGWVEKKPDYFYVENTYNGTNTISVKQTIKGSPDSSLYSKTLQYSKDKTTWSTITLSSTTYNISLNQGEKVYFRGNEGVFNHYIIRGTEQVYTKITANQTFNVGGNINTLINYYNPNNLTLPQGVFNNLFGGNVNLVSAENLILQPSSDGSLPTFAYLYLFRNCTSLTKPPVLIAKTLSKSSYYSLFDGCSQLNNLTVYTDDNSKTNCTYKWLNGVASTGTLYNNGSATYVTDSVNGIPTGWVEKKPINYFYVKNEYDGTNNVTFRAVRRPTETTIQQIEYSKDKINWTTEPITANIVITIPLEKGEKVYFRNDNGYFSNNLTGTSAFRIKIRATNNHSIGGDITTLYNYSYNSNVTIPEGCFRYLFGCDLESLSSGNSYERNPNLIDASQLILPQKNLSTGCFAGMFMLTTGLINPPQTIDCQSVGVESCHRMFKGSGITTTPSISAKTIGTNGCTEMFMECNHITTMPTLQATSLGEYCFSYMFSNCDNLGGTITLPATTTAKNCFSGMFESTAITGAIIKAKTLKQNCMTTMFKHCSNLNEVTVYATATSPTNLMMSSITSHWLDGVSSTGTFRNLGSLTFETDNVSGVPTGWVVVTE